MQLPLYPSAVVISDVIFDGSDKTIPALKFPAIIHLTLKYSPEDFHRAVVYAMGNPGHAMYASMILNKHIELHSCILKSPVAMAERVDFRLFQECILERIHDDWVVIAVINPVSDYPTVIEIQYSAEGDLPCLAIGGILELGDVREPFLVRPFC